MRTKKGALPALGVIVLIMLAGAAVFTGVKAVWNHYIDGDQDGLSQQPLTIEKPDGTKEVVTDPNDAVTEKELTSCSGISSVNALYDDLNFYKVGTDPTSNLTIYEKNDKKFKTLVIDDATSTTIPVLSSYTALAGNTLGVPKSSYFSKVIGFDTFCDDLPIQTQLMPASAPTITIVNDDAITKNSDTNHETADASSTYSPCMIVKAPSEACSAEYGAVVVFEYDATYDSKIDSSHLDSTSEGFLFPHTTNHSATNLDMDQYKVMFWNDAVMDIDGDGVNDKGALCDGEKTEICFDVTTTSSTPGEDQANVQIYWYPVNKDLDADKLTLITGIYDEDNNVIAQGNTTATYYTA